MEKMVWMTSFKENKLKEEAEANNSTLTLMTSSEVEAVASTLETSEVNNKNKKKQEQNFSLEVMLSYLTFNLWVSFTEETKFGSSFSSKLILSNARKLEMSIKY